MLFELKAGLEPAMWEYILTKNVQSPLCHFSNSIFQRTLFHFALAENFEISTYGLGARNGIEPFFTFDVLVLVICSLLCIQSGALPLSYASIFKSKIPELFVRIPGLLCCYIVLSFYGLRCISTECTHTNHAGGLLCRLAHWLLICMIIIQSHVFIYSVSKSIYSSLLILFI